MPAKTMSTYERFWTSVVKQPDDGCWLWNKSKNRQGYGRFNRGEKTIVLAHRWAYEEAHGEIAEGLTIDHMCMARACVRPDHLDAVTLLENVARYYNAVAECVDGHPRELVTRGRCQECSRIKDRQHGERRKAARRDKTVDLTRVTHGKVSTYTSYGCRCGLCSAAMAERGRANRAAKRAAA